LIQTKRPRLAGQKLFVDKRRQQVLKFFAGWLSPPLAQESFAEPPYFTLPDHHGRRRWTNRIVACPNSVPTKQKRASDGEVEQWFAENAHD
jgi:hypothetical protein